MKKKLSKEERQEILNKLYLKPSDIYLLIDGIGRKRALEIAKDLNKKMEEKHMYDPSKTDSEDRRRYLVNTELFRKEMKI